MPDPTPDPTPDPDDGYMRLALDEAAAAAARGEVPVGAVLVEAATGAVLARAGNRVEELADPTAHAEVLAIREAGRLRGRPRLPDCDLYVTLEPCALCAGAISFARLRRLVFAATDPKGGAVLHGPRFFEQKTCHHRPLVEQTPPHGAEAGELLRAFFRARR
ncbi:tRNA(Arg) A34 adenosine deaminase TadA [Inquilinus ginsengisoli]|uniref:tRNA-specific adenosine deaminase n=2 Tax=Rhodospirillaceae TaxID=41295 RepID=A0ABU1JPD7_9PROT|nr:tRNA(Arg) A34 adenosine deaminase TadA [Inquilinus ginsengisoli]